MSGRSGNRGACSQPCRLAWDLADGRGRTYIAGKHLLSVRDMNLSHRIGDLLDAGVTSFKIEGRLKDTNYIKNVVAYYRRAVDEALAVRPGFVRSPRARAFRLHARSLEELHARGIRILFAGKRPGWRRSTPRRPSASMWDAWRRFSGMGLRFSGEADLAPGDGICFITPHGVTGTNVNAAEGRRIVPNRMEGIVAGAGGPPQFRPVVQPPAGAQPHAAGDSCHGRRGGFGGGFCDDLYRLRGCHGFGRAHRAARPGEESRRQRFGAAGAGDEVGRHDFCSADAEVRGAEWFVPASLAAEVRREALSALDEARRNRPLEHRILPENPAARYPSERLTAEENVTNRLAEAFYRDHGVREIERGWTSRRRPPGIG